MENQSVTSEVILVGFPGIPKNIHDLVSTALFLDYMISLIANGSVICLVILNTYLHQPMYLVIANLAASDLLFDTVTLPKIIARYWFGSSSINFKLCIFQMFCVHTLGSLDSFLLMLMAIDRYVAISQPLRYTMIVTNKMTTIICAISWIFLAPPLNAAVAILVSEIVVCGPYPKMVNTLFCTQPALSTLACMDVTFMRKLAFFGAMVVLLVPLGLILLSYVLIILEISTSTRHENWQIAIYTCTTHLLVVALYYVPRIFFYIVTNITVILIRITPDISALLLFFYSFIPHMANPIIYFLRTKEIRQTMANCLQRIKHRVGHGFIS